MTRGLLLAALLVACGGAQKEDDARPEPDELDLDEPPPAVVTAPPSSAESAPPATEIRAPDRAAPRFHGTPIDLDVKDADLHNVLRLIADAGGASIAVADDVKGTITLRLRQVPWDQALDTVIRMEKLHLDRRGDIYLVTRSMPENDHMVPKPQ